MPHVKKHAFDTLRDQAALQLGRRISGRLDWHRIDGEVGKGFELLPRPSPGDKDFASRFDDLLECSRRSDARGVRQAVHLLEGILMELADAPLPASENDDSAAWLKRMTRMLDASVASPGER